METVPWPIPVSLLLLAAVVAVAVALIWRSLGTERRISGGWAAIGLLGLGLVFGTTALALAGLPYDNRTTIIDISPGSPNTFEYRAECSPAIVEAFGSDDGRDRFATMSTSGTVETAAPACPPSARGRLVIAAFFGAVGGTALVFGVRRLRRARSARALPTADNPRYVKLRVSTDRRSPATAPLPAFRHVTLFSGDRRCGARSRRRREVERCRATTATRRRHRRVPTM